MTDADSTANDAVDTAAPVDSVAERLESRLADALERRDAVAFVHVGFPRDPGLRYCQVALEDHEDFRGQSPAKQNRTLTAVAFEGDAREWHAATAADASTHPARALASQLADRVASGTVLTPARLPHDAALYLEEAGFEPASTDVLERARAAKTPAERERIAAAQTAAGAGIRRGAALLADATVEDGHLVADGDAVTPSRLRTAIDEGIVAAGAFPAGNTVVNPDPGYAPSSRDATVAAGGADAADEPLRPAEPIVLETAPRGPGGYHGGLVRTLVVDGDGGRERRAHVGATQSFRSAAAMLTADAESVTAVEADLEAEVRAFGFEDPDAVATRVGGVGLEPRERPLAGGDEIEPGSVVRLESAVRVEGDQWLRIADLLAKGDPGERATYLAAPSRSLEPRALLEE
ncbi:M24 family metallopeptidase [Haloterrigena sp. SYSU A121-1]|uniref:M24 family metallopeptidase n=1 Tax=Haloterrigena gelatinilytica TaxID=2741724 RepID=A0A8J8GKR0_9EURY|nr:M24 family metallopeptidase [Haloterrigena gelatinilytica]NUB89567.1 M24 family metallopeptidase [Haloterrigena gelatinilytica]